ncbi:hypothetical protein E2C01_061762 [Portunus trituberculatus]|uniref:Uncharacterized protein n=1 Tax=Portunus trituberculatus TaxID=210409 RepID=A0A5B7HC38_PORTR|nr:hypothetical protein [Portunus trituberculatus]
MNILCKQALRFVKNSRNHGQRSGIGHLGSCSGISPEVATVAAGRLLIVGSLFNSPWRTALGYVRITVPCSINPLSSRAAALGSSLARLVIAIISVTFSTSRP